MTFTIAGGPLGNRILLAPLSANNRRYKALTREPVVLGCVIKGGK
jgi:hypothetical protein